LGRDWGRFAETWETLYFLSEATHFEALGVPRRSLEGPWGVRVGPWGPWGSLLGCPWEVLGGPWGSRGELWGAPGGHKGPIGRPRGIDKTSRRLQGDFRETSSDFGGRQGGTFGTPGPLGGGP